MSAHLEGKVVVVTGGGRGIGRAIAIAAASEGAGVVVADYGGPVDRRGAVSSEAADEVVGEIQAHGGRAVATAVDVSTMDGGEAVVQVALDHFGRLDGMVCCAGITVTKFLWELEEREWDDVIAVHLKGHFSCARAAAKVLMPQRSGSLVFFSSGALAGMPSMTSYATAKAGILGFTWSTAYALESYGIRTNCVVPSAATRMSDDIYGGAGVLSDEVGETVRSELAAGTYRDPATVAPLVVYLLSDASAEINGQVLRIQGYEVSRMAELAWDRSMTSDGPWDVTSMAERLPIDLGPQLTPKPVRWPQPKR